MHGFPIKDFGNDGYYTVIIYWDWYNLAIKNIVAALLVI